MAQSISILTPILYVGVLLASLAVFSSVYRRRKVNELVNTKPWYPDNYARELYWSVKESDQKIPENVLRAALIRWAAEDVRQLLRMREGKTVLTALHQKGSVGDDVWNRFNTSQKLLELEINEIAAEANAIKPGWAEMLFQTATEVTQHEALEKRIAEFPQQQAEYRAAWERLRKTNLEELTK
ncbi:translocation protein Sec66p [Trichomonascus vanleenenianus]|uniref:Sec63 complex subunit SEC66 n=1 Tax=Trichomonascus vanleenenianus TaxID=2268995 RepID=UPI003ECB9AA3